jgi:mRNA interferase RelE/StbE
MYEVKFSNAAQRYFKKLKEKGLKNAFKDALKEIEKNPNCGTIKVGNLAGIYGYDVFYNKTNYEIAYRIYEEDGNSLIKRLVNAKPSSVSSDLRHIIGM